MHSESLKWRRLHPSRRFIIASPRVNQCFAEQYLGSPAPAGVSMLDNLSALPQGQLKYSSYTQIANFLPSIPWCPSLSSFLPSFLCGRTEGSQDCSGLPLSRLLKSIREQSVIFLQCWVWEVFALWIWADGLENLLISFFFQIIKNRTKPLESLPQFPPITVNHFLRRTLKSVVKQLKCSG